MRVTFGEKVAVVVEAGDGARVVVHHDLLPRRQLLLAVEAPVALTNSQLSNRPCQLLSGTSWLMIQEVTIRWEDDEAYIDVIEDAALEFVDEVDRAHAHAAPAALVHAELSAAHQFLQSPYLHLNPPAMHAKCMRPKYNVS